MEYATRFFKDIEDKFCGEGVTVSIAQSKPAVVALPKARELVVNAVVSIANRHGYDSALTPLEACHAAAKEILGVFDGEFPGIPQMLVFPAPPEDSQKDAAAVEDDPWNFVIPLNRRASEFGGAGKVSLADDYDIIRMRSAAAAQTMFGH